MARPEGRRRAEADGVAWFLVSANQWRRTMEASCLTAGVSDHFADPCVRAADATHAGKAPLCSTSRGYADEREG